MTEDTVKVCGVYLVFISGELSCASGLVGVPVGQRLDVGSADPVSTSEAALAAAVQRKCIPSLLCNTHKVRLSTETNKDCSYKNLACVCISSLLC